MENTVKQEGKTQRVGASARSFAMAADFEIHDPKLCAYDKATGKVLGEVALLPNATGAPMTYVLNGKQYLVVPTGGSKVYGGTLSAWGA